MDPLGQRARVDLGVIEALGQHHELIPTETGDGVRRPHQLLEAVGHGHQEAVARRMPEPVVDGLEVVQVEVEEHGAGLAAVQRRRGLAQPVGQQGTVGQAGQLVVQGLMGQ